MTETTDKTTVFDQVAETLAKLNLSVVKRDQSRPWGGFFLIDDNEIAKFIEVFFSDIKAVEFQAGARLSPKILVVAPQKRLSWQYHFRRAEVWKVVFDSKVAVKISNDDFEPDFHQVLQSGQWIQLAQGERHRLIGLDTWGIVAEIWHHTEVLPSNETDIVRLQDDYGRK